MHSRVAGHPAGETVKLVVYLIFFPIRLSLSDLRPEGFENYKIAEKERSKRDCGIVRPCFPALAKSLHRTDEWTSKSGQRFNSHEKFRGGR